MKLDWALCVGALSLSACAGAPSHRDTHGDRVPHHVSAQEYAARLDDPARAAWQMPERVVASVGVTAGNTVADIGTGSGYFLPALSAAVGGTGQVVGEDIDPALLEIAHQRIERGPLANTVTRLGTANDPLLEPGHYDLIFLVDTYHHIADRPAFLAHVRAALRAGTGRFVVIDFRDGDLPVGPPPGHKLPRAQVDRELADNGFALDREETFLPYQYLLVLRANR